MHLFKLQNQSLKFYFRQMYWLFPQNFLGHVLPCWGTAVLLVRVLSLLVCLGSSYALYMHPVCPYNNCSQRFSLRELRFSPVVISKKRTSNLISSKCIKFAQSIFQSQIKEITLGSSPNVNDVTAQQGEKVMSRYHCPDTMAPMFTACKYQ